MRIAAIGALCGFVAARVMADVTEEESLRGLDDIALIVEALHDDAARIGLTTEMLRQDATDKLDNADIRILPADERLSHPLRPYLYINCNIIYVDSIRLIAFSIDVEVHQKVTLENGEKAQALTWAKSYLGVQGQAKAASQIRQVVGDYVDQFIAAATKDRIEDKGAGLGP